MGREPYLAVVPLDGGVECGGHDVEGRERYCATPIPPPLTLELKPRHQCMRRLLYHEVGVAKVSQLRNLEDGMDISDDWLEWRVLLKRPVLAILLQLAWPSQHVHDKHERWKDESAMHCWRGKSIKEGAFFFTKLERSLLDHYRPDSSRALNCAVPLGQGPPVLPLRAAASAVSVVEWAAGRGIRWA